MPSLAGNRARARLAGRRLATIVLALIVMVLASAGAALATTRGSRPIGPWGTTSQNIVRTTVTLNSGRQFDIQYKQPSWLPTPLIVMLPGVNQTPAQLDTVSQAYAFGRVQGITIAYAHPTAAPGGVPAWNAGTCCEGQSSDDLTYLRDLVSASEQMTGVDAKHVFLVGMSNGGMMALTALCAEPDVFAAAVSVAGPFLGSTCARPTWLHFAGTADTIVPVRGGHSSNSTVCVCTFPATTTEAQRFPGAQVQVVKGANHTWPQATDTTWRFDGMTRAWSFLQPLSLP